MQKIELGSRIELFRGCAAPGVRMSEDLLNIYNDSEARVIRARSATGVRIVFETDAVEMTYALEISGAARQIFTSDIIINGEITVVDGAGPHQIVMAPGKKSVIIHLPHLAVIEKLEISRHLKTRTVNIGGGY